MTTPRIIYSGQNGSRDANDTVHAKFDFAKSSGLIEPATLSKGASTDTFGGPVRTKPNSTHYAPRAISLAGILVHQGGYAEGMNRLHDFFEAVQGAITQIQVGSLYLECGLGTPKQDRFRGHSTTIDYTVDGEAIPALYKGLYGYAVGVAQNIPTIDDRRDRTELLFGTGTNAMVDLGSNGRVFTVYNPGSAPCDLPLLISGLTASTIYYLANRDARAGAPVVFSTVASQTTFYLSAAYRVKCFPGTNTYALQSDASGTLVTSGTYKFAIPGYPSPWRYLGNDAARFNDYPAIWTLYRRGKATACTAASGTSMTAYTDMSPRVGTALGGYTAAKAGLIVEDSEKNLIQYPEDLTQAYWTTGASGSTVSGNQATDPLGAVNSMDKIVEGVAAGLHYQARTAVFTATEPGCIKVFAKAAERNWLYVGFATGLLNVAHFDLTNGVLGTVGGNVYAKIYDWGGGIYLCCVYHNSAPATDCVIGISNADQGQTYTGDGASGLYVWGVDCKVLPFPDSYVPNTEAAAGGSTRNADLVAIHLPHNYARHSHDLTQKVDQGTDSAVASDLTKWVCRGPTTVMAVARDALAADGTSTATTLTFNDETDSIFQRIVPDFRPSSSPVTFAVTVRKTAGSPASAAIQIKTNSTAATMGSGKYGDYDTLSASTAITFVDIPDTTSSRTYYVSATPATTAPDFIVQISGNSGAGNFVVEHVGVFKGLFPGLAPITESTNLPFPRSGWQYLTSFAQNGYVQFDVLLPPISTGKQYAVFGDLSAATKYMYIERESAYTVAQNYLKLARRHNGGLATNAPTDVGAIWDGLPHTIKFWWRNYTTSGTQHMYWGLDVDGVNKFTSTDLASSTVTSWSYGERLVLSDSSVFGVFNDFTFDAYAVPAGSIPALAT